MTNKTPSTGSRRARLSTRIAMTNTGKKQDNKTSSKVRIFQRLGKETINSKFRLASSQHQEVL